MTTKTTDYVELIEAFVEGYRGGRDAPGFDACVRAEINKRFAELYKAMPCEQVTPLQQACMDLNAAIDEYWMADHGIKFTGMVEQFIVKITDAQQKCKAALEGEGIALGSNP